MHSEQKYDELLQVLDSLYKYVLTKTNTEEVEVNGQKHTIVKEVTEPILLSGDGLTASRCRGCQSIRMNSSTDSQRLIGFIPCAEDWYTKVTLLKVIMECFILNFIYYIGDLADFV